MSDTMKAREWKYRAFDAQSGRWIEGHISMCADVAKEVAEESVRTMVSRMHTGNSLKTNARTVSRKPGITQKVAQKKTMRDKVRVTKIEVTPVQSEREESPVVYLIEPVDQGEGKPVGYRLTVGNEQTKQKFFEIEVMDGETSDHNEVAIERIAHMIKGGRIVKR